MEFALGALVSGTFCCLAFYMGSKFAVREDPVAPAARAFRRINAVAKKPSLSAPVRVTPEMEAAIERRGGTR